MPKGGIITLPMVLMAGNFALEAHTMDNFTSDGGAKMADAQRKIAAQGLTPHPEDWYAAQAASANYVYGPIDLEQDNVDEVLTNDKEYQLLKNVALTPPLENPDHGEYKMVPHIGSETIGRDIIAKVKEYYTQVNNPGAAQDFEDGWPKWAHKVLIFQNTSDSTKGIISYRGTADLTDVKDDAFILFGTTRLNSRWDWCAVFAAATCAVLFNPNNVDISANGVLFTGHSLGGALGGQTYRTLMKAYIEASKPGSTARSVGQPRGAPVFNPGVSLTTFAKCGKSCEDIRIYTTGVDFISFLSKFKSVDIIYIAKNESAVNRSAQALKCGFLPWVCAGEYFWNKLTASEELEKWQDDESKRIDKFPDDYFRESAEGQQAIGSVSNSSDAVAQQAIGSVANSLADFGLASGGWHVGGISSQTTTSTYVQGTQFPGGAII